MTNQSSSMGVTPTLESLGDAATRLGISIHHLRILVRDEVVPRGIVVHLGRRVLLHRRRFDDWLGEGGGSFAGGWRRESSDDAEAAGR